MKNAGEKLQALRDALKAKGLHGFMVPHTDEFQCEYTPACAERLAWLTGFMGSAGSAAVLTDKAVVMSDNRYTTQLERQVDRNLYELVNNTDTSMDAWLAANVPEGAKIGYDPMLHTANDLDTLRTALKKKSVELVAVGDNPVDSLWTDRPARPATPVEIFPEKIAGRSAADKREALAQAAIKTAGSAFYIIAKPDSIAWLLNVRAADVPHVPVALSYAIVDGKGSVAWFIEPSRVGPEVRQHLGNHVHVRDPKELEDSLRTMAAMAVGKTVLVDCGRTPVWFNNVLEKAGVKIGHLEDPTILPRTIKTPQEQAAIRDAHICDGVAMARFLCWLDGEAPKGGLTEMDVMEKLEGFRRMDPGLRDTSFTTIAGWNGNGAVIHYRATPETNKVIMPPGILLVDSGGQYPEGTTDITRTIAVGQPAQEMKETYTRVLRGNIAVGMARFPEGTTGAEIWGWGSAPLYQANRECVHGIGHDVDCYLSVHGTGGIIGKEGKRRVVSGMLLSNEPGDYYEGKFGVRIENLVLAREDGIVTNSKTGKKMLAFETVTACPLDRNLILPEMMRDDELQWLNDYHAWVYDTLSPKLEPAIQKWLKQATSPLKKNVGSDPAVRPESPAAPSP